MKPWIWMRAAALFQAFFAFGHHMGGVPRKPIRGPQEQTLFDTMRGFRFDVMGSTRSHFDFYQGFALMISVFLALLAVLMWQLGDMSRTDPQRARPLMVTLLVGELLTALLSFEYFFIAPEVTSVLVTLCLAVALATSSRPEAASQIVATR